MESKKYGSGYFGQWITDEFGLPAYKYTCNQVTDPKAISKVTKEWREETEHLHQVGNDRVNGVASNYGYIKLRQDEGSPKFLNDFNPEKNQFGGGFGYLVGEDSTLSTYYSGKEPVDSFERVFGIGYYQKKVSNSLWGVDQITFAPFGDDPLLISQVKIENNSSKVQKVRWIDYWGCDHYQFSYKAYLSAMFVKKHPSMLRRELSLKFDKNFAIFGENQGVLLTHTFQGYSVKEKIAWALQKFVMNTLGKKLTSGNVKSPVKEASFDDFTLPKIFSVSLNGQFTNYSLDADEFFGDGGVNSPSGLTTPFNFNSTSQTPGGNTGLFLESTFTLQPGESKTLYFAYGYGYEIEQIKSLISRYSNHPSELLQNSCNQWKNDRIQLQIPNKPWVDRELMWHNYYLRGNLTYDSFFREHILSQGHVYQYIAGFQGASRDPLQHMLPFIYTHPTYAKEILRYTFKTVHPNGEIPYGIAGSGIIMPSPFHPSDLELWLLWVTSEYILANRDYDFLNEIVPLYPVYGKKAKRLRIADILKLCYLHFTTVSGTGKHGIQRISNGDWNDMVVHGYVPKENVKEVENSGESTLNGAMATFALDIYSQLLDYENDHEFAKEVRKYSENQRIALQKQWTGKWMKRAWLSEEFGWIGEDYMWLEPQPWVIIGDAISQENQKILVKHIDEQVRQPSESSAMVASQLDSKKAESLGSGTNAGIWPSINGTLIMALSKIDGSMAWDEWVQNTLARHADLYPEIWLGIWSGPDTYNSVLSTNPGGTAFKDDDEDEEEVKEKKTGDLLSILWNDFPVMNMHPHAWPLYNITSLLGIQYNLGGLKMKPVIPFEEYTFKSPLLGFEKSQGKITGWYHPQKAGEWKISIELIEEEMNRVQSLLVNGINHPLIKNKNQVEFSGKSSPTSSLVWELF